MTADLPMSWTRAVIENDISTFYRSAARQDVDPDLIVWMEQDAFLALTPAERATRSWVLPTPWTRKLYRKLPYRVRKLPVTWRHWWRILRWGQ